MAIGFIFGLGASIYVFDKYIDGKIEKAFQINEFIRKVSTYVKTSVFFEGKRKYPFLFRLEIVK